MRNVFTSSRFNERVLFVSTWEDGSHPVHVSGAVDESTSSSQYPLKLILIRAEFISSPSKKVSQTSTVQRSLDHNNFLSAVSVKSLNVKAIREFV